MTVSESITFRLIIRPGGEVGVQAGTVLGNAELVGEGPNVDAAMQSLIRAVLSSPEGSTHQPHRRLRMEEEPHAPAGYFTMWARTFYIDAPIKTAGHGGELTDEEAQPIHAAITRILDEAEVEIRRKLEAIVPTYPTQPTFRLRSR
jgi:hypothetical protein